VTSRRFFTLLVSATLTGVALYYAVWAGEYTALDLVQLGQQQRQEEIRLAETRLRVDSLRELGRRLESDSASIEGVARERFGMIREGEILYRFVEVGPDR